MLFFGIILSRGLCEVFQGPLQVLIIRRLFPYRAYYRHLVKSRMDRNGLTVGPCLVNLHCFAS